METSSLRYMRALQIQPAQREHLHSFLKQKLWMTTVLLLPQHNMYAVLVLTQMCRLVGALVFSGLQLKLL